MQWPLLFPTHSEGASGSRRSCPSTCPTTVGASETSDSNLTRRCCSTSCGQSCTDNCTCESHKIQSTERTRDKKECQGNKQTQRSPAPSPAPSVSSSTKIAPPPPQSHYVHAKPGFPMMANGLDPIYAYIHPAHGQALPYPPPPPPPRQPVETSREASSTKCTCQNCQQHATTPENETRAYHCCSCCHSDGCCTDFTNYFGDASSEGSNDVGPKAGAGAEVGSEPSTISCHYYQPWYLAVPFGTPFME
ncbi:hypothetical protein N7523_002531 [Penicillium sp. IBT 18751x]|nr:hypothetical protein N7523_002531 [Penicillium sp. IBT 18751x]